MTTMVRERIGVVGAGYVGLTSAVCLAAKVFDVVCIDTDIARVRRLRRGEPVIEEPGLRGLLRTGLARRKLRFDHRYDRLADRDIVFVCAPTPTDDTGGADTSAVEHAVAGLADTLTPGSVIAMKSTVPVGTCRRLGNLLRGRGIDIVANPEFLRESRAVEDFRHPDRVVIGADGGSAAARRVARLYADDTDTILQMSLESAELAKYASNAFLAVKLSFVNSLAQLSGRVGSDIGDVARCMGSDRRIGPHFLAPGPGWGGSCLPKDSAALLHLARGHGVRLREVESAKQTNAAQLDRLVAVLHRLPRPLNQLKVAAFGLTFKAGTSDVRDSPAVAVCAGLSRAGVHVTAYDPRLATIDTGVLPIAVADDPYVAAKDVDAVLVLTEWPEFAGLDWAAIRRGAATGAAVIDTRNILDRRTVTDSELAYSGNGTPDGY